ncbi:rab3 GTPase-activating protein catalytic subunit-like isoform X2 [Anneissia japonica]|uniref:rab3 GTPase-activating protein catalytic subunit-like isoform X1 n=1 Tax=Anneissia japonica TaxID=1529436 RepID=UPI001425A162|nr:rab3 GTPase-activating protein catalytic subunit-like isoform X1 [Anneissia japonica]XP_033104848.1 rab3 GTPase-activating protein catalytic subunit-like isoform X2 [Anneissia japonica]
MSEESEDTDVFEITDFTTASEWERFIARLEHILHDWKLNNIPQSVQLKKEANEHWVERQESIQFANFKFIISEHKAVSDGQAEDVPSGKEDKAETEDRLPQAMEDMMTMDCDFPPRAHCLCRWYGVRHFVVLAPSAKSDAISSESKCNLLLSCATVAINNTNCKVPVFAQIQQKWRRMYTGVCEAPGVRTTFDMVHLMKAPPQYNHLEGLLSIFRSKIAGTVNLPHVSVSVRFTYVLQDWTHYSAWPQQPPDIEQIDSENDVSIGYAGCKDLPFGAIEDPIREFHLYTTWPCFNEDMIVDNNSFSDLDPLRAPVWSVRVRMVDDPECLLADYLLEFEKLCSRRESTEQLLGKAYQEESEGNIGQALQRLTDPGMMFIPKISTVVSRSKTRRKRRRKTENNEPEPLPNDLLNEILSFLFPDEDEKEESTSDDQISDDQQENKEKYRHFKTAPEGSLVYKLAVCMCIVNYNHGGMKAAAHLWHEFLLEMRYRLESNTLISGLKSGSPNLGYCLLHQKLQMLNCCISRKMARERRLKQTNHQASQDQNSSSEQRADDNEPRSSHTLDIEESQCSLTTSNKTDSDSDDEFFECDDDSIKHFDEVTTAITEVSSETDDGKSGTADAIRNSPDEETSSPLDSKGFVDSVAHQPEGRLRQCEDLLLQNSDEALFIPITQDPAPMTEDMLEEHAEILAKLGTSSEGAELRARMQSACLLSDMESFKAANPGCVLADFVRWYSPRDWIEEVNDDGVVKGQLSQRMKIAGNTWQEVWGQAKPCPAYRQRRLFDDTKEAEKVLHFLSSLTMGDLALHLMPVLIHAALKRVEQAEMKNLPVLRTTIEQIISSASKTTRSASQEIIKYQELIKQVRLVETVIARSESLKTKFSSQATGSKNQTEMDTFVSSLLEHPEVPVIGAAKGPAGSLIKKLFIEAHKAYRLAENGDEGSSSTHNSSKFPRPAGREFILRTTVPRPAPYSKPTHQRMFCVLMQDEFRVAGAFSEDTSFQ